MKKFYFEPAIEIKRFQAENIVTASGDSLKGTKDVEVPTGKSAKEISFNEFHFTF